MRGKLKLINSMKAIVFMVAALFISMFGFCQRIQPGSSEKLTEAEKISLMKAVLADPIWQSYSAVYKQQAKAVDFSLRFMKKDRLKLSAERPICGKNIETTLMQAGIPNVKEIVRLERSLAELSKQLNERYPQFSNLQIDDWLRFYRECN